MAMSIQAEPARCVPVGRGSTATVADQAAGIPCRQRAGPPRKRRPASSRIVADA